MAALEQTLCEVQAELLTLRQTGSASPAQLDRLIGTLTGAQSHPIKAAAAPYLSTRELAVLTHAANGVTNSEIGAMLGVAEGTVEAYMHAAARKLEASNSVEAVIAARALALIV